MQSKHAFLTMMRQNAELLRKRDEENPVDWGARRTWWVGKVEKLYDEASQWLSPLLMAGEIAFEFEQLELAEEYVGKYTARKLTIASGLRKFSMTPVATVIVGGSGLIDVDGPKGRAKLVLATPDEAPAESYLETAVWHVTAPNHQIALKRLTEEEFLILFAELMGFTEN